VAAGPSEVLGERVERGAFGARERHGERAASYVASHELSRAGHLGWSRSRSRWCW
jgi:hypothetical protein